MKRVKAFYTVKELAETIGCDPSTVRRMLTRHGVRVLGGGRRGADIRVPVSEVLEKFDVIFSSHKFSESLRK